MPILLVAIIDDVSKVWEVLDAWEALGINGATVFDSSGLHKARQVRDDLPLFPSVAELLQGSETHHRTVWTVLNDETAVAGLVRATETVVGPLDNPHTGLLFTLPVLQVWGLRDRSTPDK